MIVCADADVERAANAAAFYSMNNGGQVCISSSGPTSRRRSTTNSAIGTKSIRALRQGQPTGPGSVDIGAVTFAPQIDIVDEHVQDASARARRSSSAVTSARAKDVSSSRRC